MAPVAVGAFLLVLVAGCIAPPVGAAKGDDPLVLILDRSYLSAPCGHYTVSGRIVDNSTGHGVEGVLIEVWDEALPNDTRNSTTTTTTGRFQLDGVVAEQGKESSMGLRATEPAPAGRQQNFTFQAVFPYDSCGAPAITTGGAVAALALAAIGTVLARRRNIIR